jgi:zinc protease
LAHLKGIILDSNTARNEIPSIPPGTRLVTLENGLTLIVREDHSAPVVSTQAWCKAGSVDEGKWLGAGLSHVLEHMLFKGTSTRGPGRIDQEVQDAGGYMNAYTSFDRTVYWINVPNTGARVAVDILCDIMQNATLPEDEMVKEKQVILREMDMNHDDPSHRSARRLFETAYTLSPYRYPIIGCPDIYNEVRREDVVDYYREKYAPNNLFYVVVGDVQAETVLEQIQTAFADAKARPIPPLVLPEEPPQMAPREIIEEASIEMGHFHYSWHIPGVRHPDLPLLDVLATLLGGGRSSRLYQQVREQLGLVHSVDAWTYTPGNPGLLGMSALVDADKFERSRQAMLKELERMRQETVRDAELSKAVKQFISSSLSTRKTMQGQAQDLGGNWLAAHDLNFSARYLEVVKRVTPADLQRVAQTHLTPENRTLYALLPEGTQVRAEAVPEANVDHPVHKFELANGLRLLVKEDHRLPFVEFRALFKGGVLAETPKENGLTLLMSRMLIKGTPTRSAEQIATEIESIGGHLETYSANNSFGISAEVLSNDFAVGLDLLADVVLRPAFPEGSFERERQVQLAQIKAQKDDLLSSAFRLMRRRLFGETGYGMPSTGSESTVSSLRVQDLKHIHSRLSLPNNCVLAVFGDVQPEDVKTAVETRFGSWNSGRPVLEAPPVSPFPDSLQHLVETRDKKQAVLVVGFPGCSVFDPDRYPLELIQEACSDLGSRLFMRIRDELGLAYFVGAQNMLGLIPGSFAFYVGTEPEKANLVERELLKEAEALRREGLTDVELRRAKAKILGQHKIARQDLGHLAINAALDELYGLGFQYGSGEDERYEAVTLDQVKLAAQKYLRPQTAVVALLTPALDGAPTATPVSPMQPVA